MIEDQIKAIAEEYVKHTTAQQYVWRFQTETDLKIAIRAEALQLLKYLSTHYCIVEREKVMNAYNSNLQKENDTRRKGFDDYVYTYRNEQLTDLFGTSMFNQNEE